MLVKRCAVSKYVNPKCLITSSVQPSCTLQSWCMEGGKVTQFIPVTIFFLDYIPPSFFTTYERKGLQLDLGNRLCLCPLLVLLQKPEMVPAMKNNKTRSMLTETELTQGAQFTGRFSCAFPIDTDKH